MQRSESPTFERVGERRRVTIVNVVAEDETASRDMEDSNSHNEQEVNDDSIDNEDGHSNSNTVVVWILSLKVRINVMNSLVDLIGKCQYVSLNKNKYAVKRDWINLEEVMHVNYTEWHAL